MQELPDVVITGVATTNALATEAEATWAALLEGSSGIRSLSAPFVDELDLPVRIGGQLLEDFDDGADLAAQLTSDWSQLRTAFHELENES